MPAHDSRCATIRFETWGDLLKLGMELDNWFFRGQSDSYWDLTSSLERANGVKPDDTFCWSHAEKWMLRKFKGSAHQHLHHVPADVDLVEWVALMQHHGAPTRLLDCTYSFPVAAYFAAKDVNTECAVWAFNWRRFRQTAAVRFDLDPGVSTDEFLGAMHHRANEFLSGQAKGALVFPVDPTRENQRRTSQQGLFLFPTDASKTFMENLKSLFLKDWAGELPDSATIEPFDPSEHHEQALRRLAVVKLVLPVSQRAAAVDSLFRMNIHEASLFPGLDGLARSLVRFTSGW